MKSNYKILGDYIEPCEEKNDGNVIKKLQGISNQKYFQKAKTNTIGVDLSKYRIVRKGQFAFNRATTRNGDKISVALMEDEDCIVSPSYRIFKSKDENILNSEYLLMWFKRPDFDRYARFKSHGSAHEFFDYDEMCEVQLPLPSIDIQREIVKEYKTIKNRIALNNQLIQKLEETAQAIYKQWFVDFEFPDENGKPYKSSGGKMVWNEELEKEIPEGWEVGNLEKLIEFKNGKSKPKTKGSYPVYGGNGVLGFVDSYNNENIIAVGRVGAYCGSLYRELGKCWISDNAISAKSKINTNMYCFYLLSELNLNERSEGTGQPLITQGLLNGIKILIALSNYMQLFEKEALTIFKHTTVLRNENVKLDNFMSLLLSKLATIED